MGIIPADYDEAELTKYLDKKREQERIDRREQHRQYSSIQTSLNRSHTEKAPIKTTERRLALSEDEFAESWMRHCSIDANKPIPAGLLLCGYNDQIYSTIEDALSLAILLGAPGARKLVNTLPLTFVEVDDELYQEACIWTGRYSDSLKNGEIFGASISVYFNFIRANYGNRFEHAGPEVTDALLKLGAACREWELIARNKVVATQGRIAKEGSEKAREANKGKKSRHVSYRVEKMQEVLDEGTVTKKSEASIIAKKRLDKERDECVRKLISKGESKGDALAIAEDELGPSVPAKTILRAYDRREKQQN